MNNSELIKGFLAEHNNYDGLFPHPVCRKLEGRYDAIFSGENVYEAGVYRLNDQLVLAEFRMANVEGLASWIPGAQYKSQEYVLIKNPNNTAVINLHLDFGERNAIFHDKESDLVFAGRVTDGQRIVVQRPVMQPYQERFRKTLIELDDAVRKSATVYEVAV